MADPHLRRITVSQCCVEGKPRLGFSRAQVFPHGGNQMSLACVGGLGLVGCEACPGVFGAFAGYADDARVEDGWMRLPDRPGIGFEAQSELYALMRDLAPEAGG